MPTTGDDLDDSVIFRGQWGVARFARASDGSLMAKTDWEGQSAKWRSSFVAIFAAIFENRNLQLFNSELFKKVDGELYELKRNGLKSRVFVFRHANCWYVVSVFVGKKEDDLPVGVVKRAMQRVQQAKAVLTRSTGRGASERI